MELLIFNSILGPQEPHEFFRMDDICLLVTKFYPQDFKNHEKLFLKVEPHHFEH